MNIPEGYKLVPVDPTGDQIQAALRNSGIVQAYCAMVDAAQTVELPAYDEAKERELCRQDWLNTWTKTDSSFELYLEGWQACAKSRARSAE